MSARRRVRDGECESASARRRAQNGERELARASQRARDGEHFLEISQFCEFAHIARSRSRSYVQTEAARALFHSWFESHYPGASFAKEFGAIEAAVLKWHRFASADQTKIAENSQFYCQLPFFTSLFPANGIS